jgi:hypothetical protein
MTPIAREVGRVGLERGRRQRGSAHAATAVHTRATPVERELDATELAPKRRLFAPLESLEQPRTASGQRLCRGDELRGQQRRGRKRRCRNELMLDVGIHGACSVQIGAWRACEIDASGRMQDRPESPPGTGTCVSRLRVSCHRHDDIVQRGGNTPVVERTHRKPSTGERRERLRHAGEAPLARSRSLDARAPASVLRHTARLKSSIVADRARRLDDRARGCYESRPPAPPTWRTRRR